MGLTREQILAADDLARETVMVPEWSGTVTVRAMTGAERDEFEQAVYREVDGKPETERRNFRAQLLSRTIADDRGERMFTAADVEALGRKSARALDRLLPVARRLNGLGSDEIEALEKNS